MGGEDWCEGTEGEYAAQSIFKSIMMFESSSGPDLVNTDAWSQKSIAGSHCGPVMAVGGLVMMRNGSWLKNNLGDIDHSSGWGYLFIKEGVIDGRVTSPAGQFLMTVEGDVAGQDIAAIGEAHGKSVLLSSCWQPPALVVSLVVELRRCSTSLSLKRHCFGDVDDERSNGHFLMSF